MEPVAISGPMMLFLICMTGFAGVVDSAAGGGGLISLPAYLFAGLPAHYTYGTNKFSAACGTTFATARFLKSGALDLKVGLLAAAGSFAGSAAGSHLAVLLSDGTLRLMDGYTGSTIHTVNLGSAIQASPAAYGNTIVVGTTGGMLYFVDLK